MLEDSVMLIRNVIQLIRLAIIAHRNANRTSTRVVDIELSGMENGELLYEPNIQIGGDTNENEYTWDDYDY
jgi:hypothetical protein